MKTQILAALGENNLQPAARINAALAANDRVKYVFSLLQMALARAEHPDQPAPGLKRERIACGIDDSDLDTVVKEARMIGKSCRVAGAARVVARLADDMRLMAAPVLATDPDALAARLDALLAALPTGSDDLLDPDAILQITQVGDGHADSLHRLVMELHKRLNTMQAALAEESLDGAAAYNLIEADRPMVSAFMAGLNRTAKLKFNHPGLATTATRADGRLVIQNDTARRTRM
jgi:HPt (histidine-containing phosphotransfer) domain-containing protein